MFAKVFDSNFLAHFEELRKRTLIALIAFAAFSALAYFFSRPLISFFTFPLRSLTGQDLYFLTPYEAFLVHLKVSVTAGFLAATPVVFTELWLFVSPGLYPGEKKIIVPLITASILFFLAGAAFAFWVVVPVGLRFLMSFQTDFLKPLLSIGPYFSFLIGMVFACGIIFDLPVVILGLAKVGIINSGMLSRFRKIAIVIIFLFAAVLTPSPDPFSQILLACPLTALYEICIWAAKWMEKGATSLPRVVSVTE